MVPLLSQLKNNLQKELNVIILCAGKGTRIKTKNPSIPKALIKIKEFDNKPILEIVLDLLLKSEKINQVWIVTGYLGEKIESFVAKLTSTNKSMGTKLRLINAIHNYEKGPLFSLLTVASNHQINNNQTYLTIPGDTIYDEELLDTVLSIITTHFKSKSAIPAIFYRVLNESNIQKLSDPKQEVKIINTVTVKENGIILEFLENISEITLKSPKKGKNIKQLYPFFAFDYDFFMHLVNVAPKKKIKTIYRALNEVKKEYKVQAYKIENKGSFFDIDTNKDLKALSKKKKSGQ
ncbi:MAG: hypothetical protein EU533_04690 [Promethearchaeota archaeon]|nr:MAG: hypothetical protein EU533_04690 [Candidatus Lokiarchaeota archaeon]